MATARVQIQIKRSGKGARAVAKSVEVKTARASYNAARVVESSAKRRAHVITGRMKKSIKRTKLATGKHRVVVGAHYGIYEEFGTRYRPPHPFFRPAVEEAKAKFAHDIRRVFQ